MVYRGKKLVQCSKIFFGTGKQRIKANPKPGETHRSDALKRSNSQERVSTTHLLE